jgi:hypothetical protein
MSTIVHYKNGKGPNRDGTSLAAKYIKQKEALNSIIEDAHAGDPRAKSMLKRDVDIALRKRDIGPADVQGVPILNNLSVAYAAEDLIGLELFPLVPVEKESGSYFVHERRDRLQKPKTKGRGARGDANEINRRKTTALYACEPEQLLGNLPVQVAMNSDQPLTEDVNHDLALNREREHAELAGDPDNYSTSNKMTLTSGTRWDDADARILANIKAGIAGMWRGKGNSRLVGWTSLEVWNVISLNVGLLSLLGLNDVGAVSPERFLDITGLDGLLVSDARTDTANIGQPAVYQRLWGNKFGIMRVSDTPMQRNASFGYTFRWTGKGGQGAPPNGWAGGVFSQMWYDQKEGPFGSWFYKRSHSEDRVIVAADTGFLFDTPINGTF